MGLARAFERWLELDDDDLAVACAFGTTSVPETLLPSTKAPWTQPVQTKGTLPAGLRLQEMAQHQADDLYFNCREKFTKDHHKSCTMKGLYFYGAG